MILNHSFKCSKISFRFESDLDVVAVDKGLLRAVLEWEDTPFSVINRDVSED